MPQIEVTYEIYANGILKQDEAGAVVPDAVCNLWIRSEVAVQGLRSEYLSREGDPHQKRLHQVVQREDERAVMAGLMTTNAAARSKKKKNILEISVWILSGDSHADQPAERRLGGENRAGDSYVAKSSRSHS